MVWGLVIWNLMAEVTYAATKWHTLEFDVLTAELLSLCWSLQVATGLNLIRCFWNWMLVELAQFGPLNVDIYDFWLPSLLWLILFGIVIICSLIVQLYLGKWQSTRLSRLSSYHLFKSLSFSRLLKLLTSVPLTPGELLVLLCPRIFNLLAE